MHVQHFILIEFFTYDISSSDSYNKPMKQAGWKETVTQKPVVSINC